jgi:predicted unusual protein kinase regulating ubiquinone biosynthesis (AarF/ABC1/UbiB family)
MDQEPNRIPSIPRGRVRRAAPLVGLAGRTAGEAVIASLRRKDRSEASQARSAQRYADMMGRSKGVLMKAGQIMSFVTVGPAVPDEYRTVFQATLAKLQDDAPPMPAELAASVVEAELGGPPSKVFAEFETEPLAAASIGQVHAARLHDGRRVAVKIQYPGVEAAIRADLENAELLATFFSLAQAFTPEFRGLDVRALAREVSARIGEEIDYRTEARNHTAFADAYRGHPFIHIPAVIPEHCTGRVFTTELVEGHRWKAALTADSELRDRWGEAIFRFSLGSLRRLRLFNADPHPGNYLFHDDGSVSFLDFGCVKYFTVSQVATMRGIAQATVDRDAATLFSVFDRAGFIGDNDLEPGDVLAWMSESLKPLIDPQPFSYTPEFAADAVRAEMSPVGRYRKVVGKLSIQPDYLFLTRINMGISAVLGALGATGPWEAIRREWDCAGPPGSPYGELDKAYWAAHHDH